MKKAISLVCCFLVFLMPAFVAVQVQAQKKASAAGRKPTDKEFLEAVNNDRWGEVRQMILRGANVNAVSDANSWTALHMTAYYQQPDLVALLLAKGANVALLEDDGSTALHNAVAGCKCETAAQQSVAVKIIDSLAKAKINANLADKDGYTPLMLAIRLDNADKGVAIVKALLAAGSDLNFVNRFGENAAFLVKASGKNDASGQFVLAQSAPSNGIITEKISDEEFLKILDSANWNRAKRMVAAGANVNAAKDGDGDPALHYAAIYNNFEMVKLLVEKGARVNVSDEHSGTTPLHSALNPLNGSANYELIEYLLDHGADPNAPIKVMEKWRPLSGAISSGNIAIIKLLLTRGADPNLIVEDDRNALDQAIYEEKPEIVELLKPLMTTTTTAAKRRANLPGKFISTAPNVEIYYELYGAEKKGMPLVVLHGGPGFDHQYFLTSPAFAGLAENRPVLFYDQRGTGFSSPLATSQTSTVEDQLKDLTSLVNQLGYEKFDLMGHSWGGFLAMLYAEVFPGRLSHLILCDTMAPDFANFDNYSALETDYPEEFAQWRQKGLEGSMGHDAQAMRESQIAYMKMLFHSPQKRDAFIAASGDFTYNARVNQSLNSSADNLDLTPGLRKIPVPTLILHGKYDSNIKPALAEKIHAQIPKSKLVIFESSGHLPFYEEPEKFISVVETFLNGK